MTVQTTLKVATRRGPSAAASADGTLSRRDRRKLEVRNRILEAAVALFDRRGFADTRVAEICERADVAHKTFFNHFASKQDLLREIARDALDQLLDDIEDTRRQRSTFAERIEFFFRRIADNAEAAGPMRREMLNELIYTAHDTGTEPERVRLLHTAFGSLVADALANGELTRDHDPNVLTEMILGAFYVLMFNWAHVDGYALRPHAIAAARFLAKAMTPNASAPRRRTATKR